MYYFSFINLFEFISTFECQSVESQGTTICKKQTTNRLKHDLVYFRLKKRTYARHLGSLNQDQSKYRTHQNDEQKESQLFCTFPDGNISQALQVFFALVRFPSITFALRCQGRWKRIMTLGWILDRKQTIRRRCAGKSGWRSSGTRLHLHRQAE